MFEAMGIATGVDYNLLMAHAKHCKQGLPDEPPYGMTPWPVCPRAGSPPPDPAKPRRRPPLGTTAPPPHRLYYLHNFVRAFRLAAHPLCRCAGRASRDFFARFAQLPEPAQALLVRLVMRRGPWFRAGKLAYEEIGDIHTAAAPLLGPGWLMPRPR